MATIFRESEPKTETLPKISTSVSVIFFLLIISFSVVYILGWLEPNTNTQMIPINMCSPIRFKCDGCPFSLGCTIMVTGSRSISANSQLGLTHTKLTHISGGEIITLYVCPGNKEAIVLSFNTTRTDEHGNKIFGECTINNKNYTHIGSLETQPNVWSDLNITINRGWYISPVVEYFMWKTTLLSNDTTIRFQEGNNVEDTDNMCWPDEYTANKYYCSLIRLSSISWVTTEKNDSFLVLIGIIGGFIGIFYRLLFFIMWSLRRVHQKLVPSEKPDSMSVVLLEV